MKIAVLMSTYNGEEYVREQIESILEQKDVELMLYIRDDGSRDATTDIIAGYADKDERVVFLNRDRTENLGIRDSFLTLLEYAYQETDADYFAFADQDDVWQSDKLIAAERKLEQAEKNGKGRLYYSNKSFVDRDLQLIREEKIRYYGDLYECLMKSLASGCTMLFDRELAGHVTKGRPNCPMIHDSWVYHTAKAIGSTIIFDEKSYILYRQHGDNTVGIEGAKLHHTSTCYLIKQSIIALPRRTSHQKQQRIQAVYDVFRDQIPEKNLRIVEDFLRYRGNWGAKRRLIFNAKVLKRGCKTYAVWVYSIIFNRI